jgi:uncharacterized membrane protein YphA (DoxX/SURF4 family)
MQTINFMKNVAIMGGLAMVAAFGPGPVSVDARQEAPRLAGADLNVVPKGA